jgi:hypothetical protein
MGGRFPAVPRSVRANVRVGSSVVRAGRGTAALLLLGLIVAGGALAAPLGDRGNPSVSPRPDSTAVYNVTFSGHLPSGSDWTVKLGSDSQTAATAAITFVEPNGTYAYRISGPPGYNASQPTGNVTVAGAPIKTPVAWVTHLYPVVFTETGLPAGSTWHIFLNYSNLIANQSQPILFHSPNGTFPFTAGSNLLWTPMPLNGNVVVHGEEVNISVVFSPPSTRYTVTFQESGLVAGATWTFSVEGVVHNALAPTPVLELFADGSYGYSVSPSNGYLPHPGAGTVVVAGANVTVTIVFTAPENFSVVLHESGLPAGRWWVALTDPLENLSAAPGSSITFNLPNGTYVYRTGTTDPGWSTSAPGGTVIVAAANVTVATVPFAGAPALWPVEFDPVGVGSASWWIAIGNLSLDAVGGIPIFFNLTNGSYVWTAGASAGLFAHPPGGTVNVAGSPSTVPVTFAPSSTGTGATGLLAGHGTEILAGVLSVLGIAVVAFLLWRRRGRTRSTSAPVPPSAETPGGPNGPA